METRDETLINPAHAHDKHIHIYKRHKKYVKQGEEENKEIQIPIMPEKDDFLSLYWLC